MVITMKNNSHNHKKSQKLIERVKRKREVVNLIINALEKEDDLTIAQLVDKSGLSRGNLNHYLKGLVKRGLIIKKRQKDIHGRPTFLKLNKKKIKEMEKLSSKKWKSFEEYNLKSMLATKILDEIEKQQSSDKQHQKLIKMFKQFGKEGFGAKLIFLLYDDDLLKVDYKLTLTDKGKAQLKKNLKAKKLNP